MKIFYCGCKSIMRAERMAFPRSSKVVEVSEESGNKLLKIDGFYPSMNEDAKKALAFNSKREKLEKQKLELGVNIVEVQDESLVKEIESLKFRLEEAIDGSQMSPLAAENEKLSEELKELKDGIAADEAHLKDVTNKLAKAVAELKKVKAKVTAFEMTSQAAKG